MKRLLSILVCLAALHGTPALGETEAPAINVRVRAADLASDNLSIKSFDDLKVWIDGQAPAVTGITLSNTLGAIVGTQTAVGMPFDHDLSAWLTDGLEHYEIMEEDCTGKRLQEPQARNSTCFALIRPHAEWFYPLPGNLRVKAEDWTKDIPLMGKAHHFDPLRLTWEIVSGDPLAFDVNGGPFIHGREGDGQWARGSTVEWRLTNHSAEYDSVPLRVSLAGMTDRFQILQDTCNGQVIPKKGHCTVRVQALSDWWGALEATLTVEARDIRVETRNGGHFYDPDQVFVQPLRGRAHHFHKPRLEISLVSGVPADLEVVGPAQPSYSAPVRVRIANPTTEFPIRNVVTEFRNVTGPGGYQFVSNVCHSGTLEPMQTCDLDFRAWASWFGQKQGEFYVYGDYIDEFTDVSNSRTIALGGKAHYFDVPRLELVLVSGVPEDIIVDGQFTHGRRYNGQFSTVATPTVWELRNHSTEYETTPIRMGLTNTTNYFFEANSCANAVIAKAGSCTFQVRGQADWWGYFDGRLDLAQRDMLITTTQRPSFRHPDIEISRDLHIRAHRFDQPQVVIEVTDGDPADMEVLGPGHRQTTLSHTVSLRIRNVTTEYSISPLATAFDALSGPGIYEFVTNGCAGGQLVPNGECALSFRARSDWWGQMAATFRVSAPSLAAVNIAGADYSATLPVRGKAHYFDRLRMEMVQTAGHGETAFDVDGQYQYGMLFGGSWGYGTSVTYRLRNLSSEYASTPVQMGLTNTYQYHFITNGCLAAQVAALATCDFTVQAKDRWFGTHTNAMTIAARDIRIDPSRSPDFQDPDIVFTRNHAGTSHHFDPPRLAVTTLSGNPANLEVLGPAKPSLSHTARLRLQNLSTEFPTGSLTSVIESNAGIGSMEFVSDGCDVTLPVLGTCEVQVRHRSSWFGTATAQYRLYGPAERLSNIQAVQALSGAAMYFDPVVLTFERLSGNPTGFEINGQFSGTNVVSPAGQRVTYRLTNRSTEFDSSPITVSTTNANRFVVTNCGVAGRNNGSCTFTVDAQSNWWGTFPATLNVTHPAIIVPLTYTAPVTRDAASFSDGLSVRAYNFDPVRFSFRVAGGNPSGMDVQGPSQPSYSGGVTVRITNLSTEYPSGGTARSIATASAPTGSSYQFSGGGCTGETLAAQASCDAVLRASASWWGMMGGSVTIGANTGIHTNAQGYRDQTFSLAGRAYYFDLPKLVMSPTSAGFGTITGWAQGIRITGSSASFTVTNETTEWPSDSISFGTSGPFEVTGSSCGVLTAGASCSVTVRAYAESNGNHSGSVQVQQHQRPSASLSVTGVQFYTYGWVAEPWGACSAICNGGSQSRVVWCRRDDGANMGTGGGTYPGCDSGSKPPVTQSCNTNACVWASNGWGSCDQPCNGGRQTRTNYCTNPNNGGATVANGYCQGAEPATSQSCNTGTCGWASNPWGGCDRPCNGGTQTRTNYCTNPNNGGATVANSYCGGAQPSTSQSCNPSACTWSHGDWGLCDKTCGNGTQTRPLYCNSPYEGQVAHGNCGGGAPISSQTCNPQSCCNPNAWTRVSTGSCSKECGGGTRSYTEQNECGTPRSGSEDCNTHACPKVCEWHWQNGSSGQDNWYCDAVYNRRPDACSTDGEEFFEEIYSRGNPCAWSFDWWVCRCS